MPWQKGRPRDWTKKQRAQQRSFTKNFYLSRTQFADQCTCPDCITQRAAAIERERMRKLRFSENGKKSGLESVSIPTALGNRKRRRSRKKKRNGLKAMAKALDKKK